MPARRTQANSFSVAWLWGAAQEWVWAQVFQLESASFAEVEFELVRGLWVALVGKAWAVCSTAKWNMQV